MKQPHISPVGFAHVLPAQLEFPEEDDERIAYVIPAGVYYFYRYTGDRNDDFVQICL